MEENKNEILDENELSEQSTTIEEEMIDCEEGEEKDSKQEKKKRKKAEAALADAEKKLKASEEALAEANDKYLRMFAEYENFRKRTAKEREGIYADAYIDALTQILPILDNLERAVQFRDNEHESELAKGLELTLKSFVETLNKMGVYEFVVQGKPFDPNVHNAVIHVDDESFGENEVVEVFMKGYIRGDKVLRHSMVKVAN